MDWIWSSRCLELLCTSTQSINLKWAGGGGINSPRHQTSCWLKAAESSTVGWSDAIFFRASVHPVLLAVASTAHDRWSSLTQLLRRYAPCWRIKLVSTYDPPPCSLGLSATSQQYFSLRRNQPPATSQQYFSLRTNQHQPSATSQANKLRKRTDLHLFHHGDSLGSYQSVEQGDC
jgi:hypothetical protein